MVTEQLGYSARSYDRPQGELALEDLHTWVPDDIPNLLIMLCL